ncbi:FAD-dependent oxidoreductase [Actinomycetes bacterium KLBMP 9759]
MRAVVVGAGIAGLAAARALADHAGSVVVVDRDEPDADHAHDGSAVPRRGVPQGGHGHVLLVAGQRALGTLFPDLMAELVAAGAVRFDPGMSLSFFRFGAIWPRVHTELRLVTASRPLLERTVRRRVQALPGVEVRGGAAVSGLVGDGKRVTGVRLDDGTVLDADLVVDCSGRGGRSQRWLGELGHAVPRVTEITIGVGYATRLYRRKPDDLGDYEAAFALPDPPAELRAGLVLPVEDDRWLVSLGGWHGAFPRDAAGFDAHAAALPHPAIAGITAGCEALTDVAVCTLPVSRRRHFEELCDAPSGYLALGDAVCSFNPIYGQGMTCAAMEAVALGDVLAAHPAVTTELTRDFHRRAAGIVATPWTFASGGDFAYPQTKGTRPRGISVLNAYARRVQLASMADPAIRKVFTSVQHLIMDPAELRRPSMVLDVLRAARRHGRPPHRSADLRTL